MELKNYQDSVLRDLDRYIDNILDLGNAAKAYDKLWRDKGVRVGGLDGIQHYNDLLNGVPSVCFKVPTGGGKTFLGCAALKHIFDAMEKRKKKVVVWLVPWETILTQTYNNLTNPSHFYRERLNRDFSSKVQIYNKKQAISGTNFNPVSINEQLSIILLSFDSLRATNKDERKVYEENSNLLPFVETYENKDELIKNVDDSALMQVLNQLKPIVIIDESHNAQSDLSKEMIKNLNPSFVLELTATPKSDSNIISIVSANQLKEENMVKLPVIAYNRPSIERVIVEAIDLRNSLERTAIEESNKYGAPHIRPIILFQAQPKSEDESVTFEKLKENLKSIGIPEEQIAIKTANINELNGIDLMSPGCKIRYIITINALKEGWDCPFAYVLASLANRTSRIDVEQILGRILRQPHQRKYNNKLLNMSYVLTSSSDFSTTLDSILDGLNTAGFSRNDCRVVRTNTLDNLTESNSNENNDTTTNSLFDLESSQSENIDSNIFNIETVNQEIKENQEISHENKDDDSTFISNNNNVNKMLEQASQKNDEYEAEIEESQRNGTNDVPQEFRTYSNVFLVKEEFKDEINTLKLPVFSFKKENTLFFDDLMNCPVDTNYLNEGFDLNSSPIPSNITSTSDSIYKVDVESTNEGSVIKKSLLSKNDSEEFKKYLELIPEQSRINACKTTLIYELNNKFNNISYSDICNYVTRIISSLKTEDEIISLQNNIYAIGARIKDYINKLLEDYRYTNFKDKLKSNDIFVTYNHQLNLSLTLPEHTNNYLKTLYQEEDGHINSLEEKFATKISSLENVVWWHRNLEKTDYSINGYLNHYPDFIVKTKSNKIILVETKGEHLDGDDSKKKLELGNLWSSYSGPHTYKYFMAFDKSPLDADGANLLDNIIDIISKL